MRLPRALARCWTTCAIVCTASPLLAQGSAPPALPATAVHPCAERAESRQLDFWAGRWKVYPWGARDTAVLLGTSEVTPMLERCSLLENWTATRGGNGKSLNVYDPSTRRWRQLWTDDSGHVLDYAGELREGAMHFEGTTRDAAGKATLQRMIFVPVAPDSVRQIMEASGDGGKTWKRGWDAVYVRVKS